MDASLELKIKAVNNSIQSFEEAESYLNNSELFKSLLSDFELTSINLLHRLTQLSEIPFSQGNEKVKKWRDQLANITYCEVGFSLSGRSDDILACYNAMITSVLIKLEYPILFQIEKGIEWINCYQNTRRNQPNNWKGKGILKYGGCMKSTPCFIGVVKSMEALSTFKSKQQNQSVRIAQKLESGLQYILEHKVYQRKSSNQTITKDITKLTYPFTYKTNIVEILRLLRDNDLLDDPRVDEVKDLLNKKKKGTSWVVNSFYRPKFWVDFDKPKQKSEWIDFEIRNTMHNN